MLLAAARGERFRLKLSTIGERSTMAARNFNWKISFRVAGGTMKKSTAEGQANNKKNGPSI